MTKVVFFKQLIAITALVALGLFALVQVDSMAIHQALSWTSWLFFSIFCLGLYLASVRANQDKNKNRFGQVFLIGTFFKMMLSILLIIVYTLWIKPTDLYFVFPFFGIYTIYTIFEVYFMVKLSRNI